jgi:hypothetical protein
MAWDQLARAGKNRLAKIASPQGASQGIDSQSDNSIRGTPFGGDRYDEPRIPRYTPDRHGEPADPRCA